jgi:hypothetical protein
MTGGTIDIGRAFSAGASSPDAAVVAGERGRFLVGTFQSEAFIDIRPRLVEDEAAAILRDHDFMREVRAGLEDVERGRLASFEDVFGEPL